MKILISVTQDDINNGICGDAENCPIALSVKRQFNSRHVQVNNLNIITSDKEMFFWLPDIARDFIFKYDNHEKVEPFEFKVSYNN